MVRLFFKLVFVLISLFIVLRLSLSSGLRIIFILFVYSFRWRLLEIVVFRVLYRYCLSFRLF